MGVDFTPPRQNGIEALSNCLVYLLALYMIIGFPDAGMGVLRMLGPSPKPMGTANVFEGRAERKKKGVEPSPAGWGKPKCVDWLGAPIAHNISRSEYRDICGNYHLFS